MSQNAMNELIETVHRLRAPGGCPWDRAQTHQSLRPYLIEEAYEVLDVLDQIHGPDDLKNEKTRQAFKEELGDVLMQVLLHSEMTREAGAFSFYDVAEALNHKLIRRHPHVFKPEDEGATSDEQARGRWEKEKAKEKAGKTGASILDGVPRGMPALQKAARVLEKVTKVGFQWEDLQGPLDKIEEELAEFKKELKAFEGGAANLKKVEDELGDIFFTLCNMALLLKISPEDALRKNLTKFERRFRHVERRLKDQGKTPEQSNLTEMDQYWNEAKAFENVTIWGLTGGIASGKSTVVQALRELGFAVLDADQISRSLLQSEGPAQAVVLKRFGTVDRNQIKEIIFSDPDARKDLENILHPFIQNESRRQMHELALELAQGCSKDHSQSHAVIIYEASLLIESGRFRELDGLIVVEAPLADRIERLIQRDKISKELAEKIIQSQLTDEQRRPFATLVLENTGTKAQLKERILENLSRLKNS